MTSDEKTNPAATSQGETSPQEDFAALFAASEAIDTRHKVEVGDKVRGRVIAVGQNSAFVAIGGKVEATIDLAEFRDPSTGEPTVAVGDEVEATVTDDGSQSGAVTLSRSFGRGGHVPAELERAREAGIPVEGVVTGENKGGFDVQIGSSRAFCPGSLIDRRRGGERVPAESYIGQRLRFRITKIENGGRNIVVSRRELLEEEAREEASRTWDTLRVGAVVRGKVRSLQDFGAFVDLGGVDGLIHISQLGYGRVKHPRDVLEVGQDVEVQVVKVDEPDGSDTRKRRQVGLSLKALSADPWSTVRERFPVGSSATGTVTRVEPFGAFVELAPGLEGLVHISKITLDRRLSHSRQAVNVGDSVEVSILSIDEEQRRLSLSMVEHARQLRDASEAAERAENAQVMGKTNERRSLGTMADLLSNSKRK